MDTENMKIWVSQPNVCRCCLSANGTFDLQASYVNEYGQKEAYCETLQNCFGINMLISEWGCDSLHKWCICTACAEHIKNANKFKQQVLQAEQSFAQYFNKTDNFQVNIEPEMDNDNSPDDFLITQSESTKAITKYKQKSHTKKKKVKQKNTQKTLDWDSDTPLKELTRVKEIEDDLNSELLMKEREGDLTSKSPNIKKTVPKTVSERKKIRLTCEIILNNTNACPFRHHKSWFQCFYCTLDFIEINQLRKHIKERHKNVTEELEKMKRYPRSLQIDINNLLCNICNVILINVDDLCCHFKEMHDKVIYKECLADFKVNSSPYGCHLCGKEFHVFRTLTTHLNEHYANCICDVCGKSFLNTKRLKVHKRTHESGHFPCTECGKVLKSKTSKSNHIETVHCKRVIKCQICFKPMKHYNDRIKHMSEEHGITHKFKCPICGREYNIKHYLATHMRQTHGHKNKKCPECGMAFITNHGLKKHMQKHSGVKEFTCDICSKSYARSYSLKEHMRAHGNDTRF